MRKLIFLVMMAGVLACGSVQAGEESSKVIQKYFIPGKYLQGAIYGLDLENQNIDFEVVKKSILDIAEKQNITLVQFLYYEKGKKEGDGIIYLVQTKDSGKSVEHIEARDVDHGKKMERLTGYILDNPIDLWQAYEDNEVVADEDFKGKPVLFRAEIQGVSKDAMNKPYIKVPVANHGLSGLHVYIKMDDPNLRKIKKGSSVVIRGVPQKYIMKDVVLNGEIVMIMDDAPKSGKGR